MIQKMIFNKLFKSVTALICTMVLLPCVFPAVPAFATLDGDGAVTIITNVETAVPGETQVQAYDTTATQALTGDDLPYNEPLIDDNEVQSLLDQVGITGGTTTIDLIILITILSLAPSIIVMLTCFTRIVISFSLLRNAMGVQQTPPNQVMIGLALFLTLFIMNPVITEMNEVAYQPYKDGEYTSTEAIQAASGPIKAWMLRNVTNDSLSFFIELSGAEVDTSTDETLLETISFVTVVPAFILSEIKTGFSIGFLLYIPFLIIDIVVSTVLMSMGMMMLPPTTVSVPFKLLMFILADGWTLLIGSLAGGFNP